MKSSRILWVCNIKPAIVSEILGQPQNCFGGWLDTMSKELLNMGNDLLIMYPDSIEIMGEEDSLRYCSFLEHDCLTRFSSAIEEFRPEVVHIWGTEYRHSYECMRACENLNLTMHCVISIQGLVSLYGKYHYMEGLPSNVIRKRTLRDILKKSGIQHEKETFCKRGEFETAALEICRHVIGRTEWDYAAVRRVNPFAEYHFCNETLREVFYKKNWDISKIDKYRIFVSQCNYPIKGFHYLLQAMPDILSKYPKTHIYTTGKNLVGLSWSQKMRLTSYQLYLSQLIEKYGLQKNITFLGTLSADQMCEQYLKANVFVSPSTIENSSNSVGEAMLLGCPVVSSNVGGINNLLKHGMEGYIYQSSAPYMLAYYVNKVFDDDNNALQMSHNAMQRAQVTHNREKNIRDLCAIYDSIINREI